MSRSERDRDFTVRETQRYMREVEGVYTPLHNDLDPELRTALKPLNDARDLMMQKGQTLRTIAAEHEAGRLADDQVPKLRAQVLKDMEAAQAAAAKAVSARLKHLPRELRQRAFPSPPRGAETAEAKTDLRMVLDQGNPLNTAPAAAAAAVRDGDELALSLLASDWGANYTASRGATPEAAAATQAEVQRIAAAAPELFSDDRRKDLARLARMQDLERAYAAGLNLVDMQRQAVVEGRD